MPEESRLTSPLKPDIEQHSRLRKKQQVAHQFSRAAKSYDQAADIQALAVKKLIEALQTNISDQLNGHWLDIGCGTGAAFKSLLDLGIEQITGLDLSEGMLNQAALQHAELIENNRVTLTLADADQLPFSSAKPLTAENPNQTTAGHRDRIKGIFSSLMLQWSEDPSTTLGEWHRVLDSQGYLAVATLLPGTHQEIETTWKAIDNYRHVNEFTSQEVLHQALNKNGFHIVFEHTETHRHLYPDVMTLLRGLKSIGATNVNTDRRPGLSSRKLMHLFEQHYPRSEKGNCPLSYHLHWFIARKL